MLLNKAVSESLSKTITGFKGIIAHFFIIGAIYGIIINVLFKIVIAVTAKKIPLARKTQMENIIKKNPYDLINIPEIRPYLIFIIVLIGISFILQFIGTIKVSKVYIRAKKNKYQTFGKARFAETDEVLKTGLHGPGIVFGKIKRKLITKPSNIEGHTLIVGGTGTGKSRGIVIPSLMMWQGSAIVMDIKGELSKITSEKRKIKGNNIYIFNPEGESDCYNPIALCNSIDNAQELARTLIPLPDRGENFWCQSAQAIFSSFIFEGAKKGYTLSEIAENICTTPINKLIENCKNNSIREVRILASIAYDMPDEALGGVMAELKSKLITIATDENIRRVTQKSDWTPETLEHNSTIYLKVSEHLLEQYKDLWTVIINQILRYLSKRKEKKNPPILIALDELPRLGEIKGLTNALATLRSRNVHILGVIQSMAQLDEIYNQNQRKIIADNCRFKLVLSATDPETQKYFSDLAGQKTAMAKGVTVGASFLPNISSHEQGVPLVRPEQWANLDKPILFAPKLQPLPINLAFWDKEKF